MKKIFLLFFVLMLLTACNNQEGISLQATLDTFEENGIQLEEVRNGDSETFGMKLNGVKPSTYSFNNETFFIYIFNDIEERKEGWEDFYNLTASKNTVNYDKFEEKNLLIFHVYDTKSNININQILDNL